MSQKQASKRRHRKKAVAVLGAAGVLSLAGSASAAIVGPAADTPKADNPSRHVITLSEEEIFDVSLATFYVYDKENARTHLAAQNGKSSGKACGTGHCGGGKACGTGCRGSKACRVSGGGCGGCGGYAGGGCCLEASRSAAEDGPA
jgi:hypothetical protein